MQIAIVDVQLGNVVEKVDAESDQKAINDYAEKLAIQAGLDTGVEFCQQFPHIAMKLRAFVLH